MFGVRCCCRGARLPACFEWRVWCRVAALPTCLAISFPVFRTCRPPGRGRRVRYGELRSPSCTPFHPPGAPLPWLSYPLETPGLRFDSGRVLESRPSSFGLNVGTRRGLQGRACPGKELRKAPRLCWSFRPVCWGQVVATRRIPFRSAFRESSPEWVPGSSSLPESRVQRAIALREHFDLGALMRYSPVVKSGSGR